MENYRGVFLGSRSKIKPNYEFTFEGKCFVRHSLTSIKKVVKELNLKYAFIQSDRNFKYTDGNIANNHTYFPKY